MKTIRNEIKKSHRCTITNATIEGIKSCRYSIFYTVTKRTCRQQTKNQIKLGRKRFRNHKAIQLSSKYVQMHFLQQPIMYYVTSH